MRRSTFWTILLTLVGTSVPSVGTAAFHRPAARRAQAAARPVKASPSHWKAQVGSLRPYAKAGSVRATRIVGNRAVQYAPSKFSIGGLLAKRALNPARFDMAHPNLGRLLERDARLRAAGTSGPYNGLLVPSAYHNYLRWRWSLNPARFEHYHPILGVILAEDNRLQNLTPAYSPGLITPPPISLLPTNPPPINPPPSIIPPPPGGTPGGGGGGGGPGPGGTPAVPEPASIVLMALGASFVGIHHARRTLRTRSRDAAQG
jgi:hypothetical protein